RGPQHRCDNPCQQDLSRLTGPHQRRYPSLWRCARCLISTDLPSTNPHTILRHDPEDFVQLHRARTGYGAHPQESPVVGCGATDSATSPPPLHTPGEHPSSPCHSGNPDRWASPLPLAGILRTRQEHQPELTDLDLVAAGQRGLIHRLAVDVRSVETADIADDIFPALTAELRVSP